MSYQFGYSDDCHRKKWAKKCDKKRNIIANSFLVSFSDVILTTNKWKEFVFSPNWKII